MILLSRFLDTFWIEPNAKNFFAKHVPEGPLGYSHLQPAYTSSVRLPTSRVRQQNLSEIPLGP